MTLDRDDQPGAEFLTKLTALRSYDVSPRRSRQLRRRCHAMLRAEPPVRRASWMVDGAPIQRVVIPALGGAWCLAYLVQIIRCTAAIYGYFGRP